MKKIVLSLLLFASVTANSQVKISQLPTHTGDPAGGYVPITIGSATKKVDARYFGYGKLDSVVIRNDSIYTYKNGTASFVGKLISDGNNYVNLFAFDSTTGDIAVGRNGMSAIVTNLDGRYLIKNAVSANPPLLFNPSTGIFDLDTNSTFGLVNRARLYKVADSVANIGIKNQNGGAQTGNFWISGIGTANGFQARYTGGVNPAYTFYNSLGDLGGGLFFDNSSAGDVYLRSYNNRVFISGQGGTPAFSVGNYGTQYLLPILFQDVSTNYSSGGYKMAVANLTTKKLEFLPTDSIPINVADPLTFSSGKIGFRQSLNDSLTRSLRPDVTNISKGLVGILWTNSNGGNGNISDLLQPVLGTLSSGQLLRWDGSKWANWTPTYLTSVDVPNKDSIRHTIYDIASGSNTDGTVTLTYTKWDGTVSPGRFVNAGWIDSPTEGQILTYNSSLDSWVNTDPGATTSSINAATDANITSPANNELLKYSTSDNKWHNTVLAASDIPALSQSQITNLVADLGKKQDTGVVSNVFVAWPLNNPNDSTIGMAKADATHDGYLDSLDYARLFTRQTSSNPTGTFTLNIDAGGQAGVTFTATGARTLAFSNLRAGDVFKITFNNTSGSTVTLTLPSNSYVAGTGTATTVTIPTGRSMLTLTDFDGTDSLFALQSY